MVNGEIETTSWCKIWLLCCGYGILSRLRIKSHHILLRSDLYENLARGLSIDWSNMSWYTISPAQYVILIPPGSFHSSIRPSHIRDQLIGTCVGIEEPLNTVRYVYKRNKVCIFRVAEVSIGSRDVSSDVSIRENALISRTTQVFFVKFKNERVYSFSSNAKDWSFVCPYSQEDAAIALRLHDPCIVSSLLGECDQIADVTCILWWAFQSSNCCSHPYNICALLFFWKLILDRILFTSSLSVPYYAAALWQQLSWLFSYHIIISLQLTFTFLIATTQYSLSMIVFNSISLLMFY